MTLKQASVFSAGLVIADDALPRLSEAPEWTGPSDLDSQAYGVGRTSSFFRQDPVLRVWKSQYPKTHRITSFNTCPMSESANTCKRNLVTVRQHHAAATGIPASWTTVLDYPSMRTVINMISSSCSSAFEITTI